MSYDLGEAHGRIVLEYDGNRAARQAEDDIRRLGRASRDADKDTSSFSKKLDNFASALGKVALGAGKGALAITSIVHAAGAAAVAIGAIVPVAAAAFAALPGIVLAGAAAMGVLKAATANVGDALKYAGNNQKKFDEAFAKLSPTAKTFVNSIIAAKDALKPMQQAMQDAFFAGTGPLITMVAKNLSGVRTEAVQVSKGFNGIINSAIGFFASSEALGKIRTILNGVSGFLFQIKGSIPSVLSGFLGLGAQASQFGDNLGKRVNDALIKLGTFLQGVDLSSLLDKAKAILEPIGELLKNIGSIISSVFGGLSVDAGGALGVFGELTGKLAEFLNTAQGQEALKALGEALGAISGATGQVFLALLQALAPVIIALAPGVADLATQVAAILVPALEKAGPLLEAVAGFLSDNIGWIGPLIIGVYAAVGAYKAFTAAQAAWTVVAKIAKSEQLASVGAWIASKAQIVGSTAALVANKIAMAASTVAGWIANTAAVVANTVVLVASKVAMFAARAATIAWTAVQWLLNAALLANPIGLIILAIIALIAIIVLIATKTTWFQDAWKAAWGWIKDAAKAVWDWISGTLWPGIQGVWDRIVAGAKATVDKMKNFFLGIWDAILKVIGFFSNLRQSVMDKLGDLLSFIAGLPGRIQGALGNLASLLYDKGKEIVQGLIDGIKNMFGNLKNVASDLINTVTDFLPGSPAKKGPLSGKGWTPHRGKALVSGIAEGMQSGLAQLEKLSLRVATVAAPVLPSAVGKAGTSQASIPITTPAVTQVDGHSEASIIIQNLNITLQGVWDFNDPQASRKVAVAVHEAIEQVKREYK